MWHGFGIKLKANVQTEKARLHLPYSLVEWPVHSQKQIGPHKIGPQESLERLPGWLKRSTEPVSSLLPSFA